MTKESDELQSLQLEEKRGNPQNKRFVACAVRAAKIWLGPSIEIVRSAISEIKEIFLKKKFAILFAN